MRNCKPIFVVLVALFALLAGSKVYAAEPCPLIPNAETVWTIDRADEDAITACTDVPNDCALYGVISKVNSDVKAFCTPAEQQATLGITIKFLDGLDLSNLVKPIELTPPADIKKLTIDGSQSSGAKTALKLNVDSIHAISISLSQAVGVEKSTDLEIKKLAVEAPHYALFVQAAGAVKNVVSVTDSDFVGAEVGAAFVKLNSADISLSNVHVAGFSKDGLSFKMVSDVNVVADNINITGAAGAANGILFYNSKIKSATLSKLNIKDVSTDIFTHLGTIKDFTVSSSKLVSTGNGVSFLDVVADGVKIVSTNVEGVKSNGGYNGSGISVRNPNRVNLFKNLEVIGNISKLASISKFATGVKLSGVVLGARLENLAISDVDVGILASGENGVILLEPQNVTFESVAIKYSATEKAVDFITKSTISHPFGDSQATKGVVNSGIDTPNDYKIKLWRDPNNLRWLKVMAQSVENCSKMQIFWAKPGSLVPVDPGKFTSKITTEKCGENDLTFCYTREVEFAKANPDGYVNEDLDGLSIAVSMTCADPFKPSANISTMISRPVKVITAEWLGMEKITVDTSDDDAAKNGCLDEVDADCSLRGAVAYIAAKRNASGLTNKLTHKIMIQFKSGLGKVNLHDILAMNDPNVIVSGPIDVNYDKDSIYIRIAGDSIIFDNVALVGINSEVGKLLDVSAKDVYLNKVSFASSAIAVLSQLSNTVVEISDPIFDKIGKVAVKLDNVAWAHVTGVTVKSIMPKDLILSDDPSATPAIIESAGYKYDENKVLLTFNYPGVPLYFDSYVSFANNLPYVLQPNAVLNPETTLKPFVYAVSPLLNWTQQAMTQWGKMEMFGIVQHNVTIGGVSKVVSTILSLPVNVLQDGFAQFDSDGDSIIDSADNCTNVKNQDQADLDKDGIGDVCDDDMDNDDILNTADNCKMMSNSNQADNDADGQGDVCDADDDNDGKLDESDTCPFEAKPVSETNCEKDTDRDSIPDSKDNCKGVSNSDQQDVDVDGQGDLCDDDDDNDGVVDTKDNCQFVQNVNQADVDSDNKGDACDFDSDNDGILDAADNCKAIANVDQLDTDDDGEGDVCDATPSGVTEPPKEAAGGGSGGGCSLIR